MQVQKLTWDHDKDEVYAAIGLTKEQADNINRRYDELSKYHDGKGARSVMLEAMYDNFTKEELIYVFFKVLENRNLYIRELQLKLMFGGLFKSED